MSETSVANEIRTTFNSLFGSNPIVYDNAPDSDDDVIPWIRLIVQTDETKQIQFGPGLSNQYQTRGSFEAYVYVDYESGDSAALTLADAIVAAYRMTTVGAIKYNVPSLTILGRVNNWWCCLVRVPLVATDTAARVAGTAHANADYDDVAKACRVRLEALALSIPIQYENEPEAIQTSLFAEASVILGDTSMTEIGVSKRYRTTGLFAIQLFAPLESGMQEALTQADLIRAHFRSVSASGLTFRSPSVVRVGKKESWYQVNVFCPFYTERI